MLIVDKKNKDYYDGVLILDMDLQKNVLKKQLNY